MPPNERPIPYLGAIMLDMLFAVLAILAVGIVVNVIATLITD